MILINGCLDSYISFSSFICLHAYNKMTDLNWCTYCDNAISQNSVSLSSTLFMECKITNIY